MLIDAHQHFWRLAERAGYWPPPELAAIYRDFSPADLVPLLQGGGVRGTVLVQTLPSIAETEQFLDLAASHDFILGVVGWVDLASPGAATDIARLAQNRKLKGLRPMLQDLPERRWIENPALAPAIAAMIEHGLAFDALVLPEHLPSLLKFAERYPALPIVIDHAAKPKIAEGLHEPWCSDLRRLAALPQVHCKLSGLLTEAGLTAAAADGAAVIKPYVETLANLFGADRLLWGSDWPVVRLASDYGRWLAICRELLAALSAPQQVAVFAGNAIRFYRLAVPAADASAVATLMEKS